MFYVLLKKSLISLRVEKKFGYKYFEFYELNSIRPTSNVYKRAMSAHSAPSNSDLGICILFTSVSHYGQLQQQ
jgi:hypothetical protein